jgi:hypothetical protein
MGSRQLKGLGNCCLKPEHPNNQANKQLHRSHKNSAFYSMPVLQVICLSQIQSQVLCHPIVRRD